MGQSCPSYENRPIIEPELNWYLQSFSILSGRRQAGMSLNPIQMGEIKSYLDMFPWYDVESFVLYITQMDSKFLEIQHKKSEQKAQSKAK